MPLCHNCGIEINQKNKRHKFCSHKCRMQSWRSQNKKELAEKSTIKKVAIAYQEKLAAATKDDYLALLIDFYEDIVKILIES